MKPNLIFAVILLLNACAHNAFKPADSAEIKELIGEWTIEKPYFYNLEGHEIRAKVGLRFTDSKMLVTNECSVEKLGLTGAASVEAKVNFLQNHRVDVLENLETTKIFGEEKKKGTKAKKDSTTFNCKATATKGIINYVIKDNRLIFLDAYGRENVIYIRR